MMRALRRTTARVIDKITSSTSHVYAERANVLVEVVNKAFQTFNIAAIIPGKAAQVGISYFSMTRATLSIPERVLHGIQGTMAVVQLGMTMYLYIENNLCTDEQNQICKSILMLELLYRGTLSIASALAEFTKEDKLAPLTLQAADDGSLTATEPYRDSQRANTVVEVINGAVQQFDPAAIIPGKAAQVGIAFFSIVRPSLSTPERVVHGIQGGICAGELAILMYLYIEGNLCENDKDKICISLSLLGLLFSGVVTITTTIGEFVKDSITPPAPPPITDAVIAAEEGQIMAEIGYMAHQRALRC